jgi:hypothetical protein
MRRRVLLIVAALLAACWLVPAVFVATYDPRTHATEHAAAGGEAVEAALGATGPTFFLLAHGYAKHWTVETWEGRDEATAVKSRTTYHVERGPLERRTGTFRFTLSCSSNQASDLEGVRLGVTSAADWSHADPGIWTQVGEAVVALPGAEEVALTCSAIVPASTTAYRLVEVRAGAACGGFSQSMLRAPTALGRVYDAIAWWPVFRWLPDLH